MASKLLKKKRKGLDEALVSPGSSQATHETDLKVEKELSRVEEKLTELERTLKSLGRSDLQGLFQGYKPRFSTKPKKAPLDQRVNISVNREEQENFLKELELLERAGTKISMSQYVRNKALGSIDIEDWRIRAEKALEELESLQSNKKGNSKRKVEIIARLEEEEDEVIRASLEKELKLLSSKINKVKSVTSKRSIRLSGRMTFQEFETIKHRASKLCLSYSDYLRMLIFNLEPGSTGDAHLSYDARRRFYISIINVSNNGWGEVQSLYNCPQCANYVEQIEELEARNRVIEKVLRG